MKPDTFHSRAAVCLSLALASFSLSPPAWGQPSNPTVRAGAATVTPGLDQTLIEQQSGRAIIHWSDFSIPGGHRVDIRQPGAGSALLNRVTGGNPSQLLGSLNANGKVYLVNPNGIVVGSGASINAAAFIASTLDVSDGDFLGGGDLLFSGSSSAGVRNLGSITASNGDVILIGVTVENQGSISAAGTAALAAGREVLYSPASDPRIRIVTTVEGEEGEALAATEEDAGEEPRATGVDNQGLIDAARAELQAAGSLYELAINQQGIIRATGVERENGRVLLTAGGGSLAVGGTLSARNADGSGGEVLIGGDYRGANPDIANAARTAIAAGAVIDVSADQGDAGRAIVWAEEATRFEGTILARGGGDAGDGGFAEVSGKRHLDFRGLADLRAPAGQAGELLLDPAALTVVAAPPDTNLTGTFGPTDPLLPSTISSATLQGQLALGNVTLDTSFVPNGPGLPDGSIVVDAPVTWTSGHRLTFQAGNDITVNQSLNGAGAEIDFALGFVNDPIAGGYPTTGRLTVDASATVTAGSVVIRRNPNATLQFSNSNDGPMGGVAFHGALASNLLDLRAAAFSGLGPGIGGFQGTVLIDNPANAIGTLANSVATGTFQDAVVVVDGQGGLTVDGGFAGEGGGFTISTPGNLTLAPGTVISTTGHDIHLASTGGAFINQAGAGALAPGGGGRFLVYSDDPANLVADGLVADPVYNKTWNGNPPAGLAQGGNRFVYSLAPTLTLTANAASKVAGEPNPVFTFTVSGLVGGDTAGEAFSGAPTLSSLADENSPDGFYAIDIALGTVNLSDFDYTLQLAGGLLTIDPAALPQLIIAVQNAARQFGDANPAFLVDFNGFLGNDNPSLVSGLQITTLAGLQSPVGFYAVTPSGASAPGYDIVFQAGTLQVVPREVTLRAGDLSKIYGDALPPFTTTFENLPAFALPSDLGTVSVTSGASFANANAGTYAILPSVTGNPNYSVTPANGTATVLKRAATITAPTLGREYGLANPAFVASGDNFLFGDFNNASLSFATAAVPASDVGDYPLAASGHSEQNYTITYVPGSLAVTPAPLTLTAQNKNREYGLANPAFTFTDSGFRLGQSIGDVVPDLALASAATPASNVGAYPITIGGTPSPNYAVTFVPGTLDVTKAPLLLAPTLANRFFGDDNPAFTLTGVGLRNGDTVDVVTGEQFQVFATAQSNVGNYPIQILAATAQNYNLTFNNGTLNILPRPLTITADHQTREYGDANPTLTAQFDSLAPFHTSADIVGLSIATVATPTSNVLPGGYGINVTVGANPNYAIGTVPGILMITPATLTVSVDDATRAYATANPAFSATTDGGLKAGDTLSDLFLTFDTPAVPQSNVGIYPISAASPNPNYAFNFVPGDLTITPAQLFVNGNAADRIYGDAPPTEAFNVAGLQFGAQAADVLRFTDPATRASPIGLYDFTVASLDPNYEVAAFNGGDFRILQRPLNISIEDVERFYGDNNPLFSLHPGSNLLPDLDPVESVLAFTAPGKFALPGNYTIDPTIINGNYRFDLRGFGRLTVLKRPLRIEIDNQARYYGDGNPAFTFREVGGVGFPDFENPDNFLVPFTLAGANSSSAPGYYLIGGRFDNALSNRYDLRSLRPGILTVAPRPVRLSIDDIFRQYANGTPLSEIGNFSGFTPTGRLGNTLGGDTLSSVFPGLTFAIVEAGTPYQVQTQPSLSALPRPALDEFGTTDLAMRPASRTSIPFRRSGGSATRSASTDARPNTFTLSADGTSFIADRPVGLTGLASIRRLAIIPAGEYLDASDLYVLTDVDPGLLTLSERTFQEELNVLRVQDEERYNELVNPSLTVVSGDFESAYAKNIGLLFRDYPDLSIDMIDSWLREQFSQGEMDLSEGGLWYAIFGGSGLEPPDFDRFTIRQWLGDIDSNVEKRALMSLAMLEYLKIMQERDPETYSPGEQALSRAILEKVNRKRGEFANELLARKQVYEDFPLASSMASRAKDNLKVLENRAAIAANNFLQDFKDQLTPAETQVLHLLVSSILDGDRGSSIPMLKEWIALREGANPRTIFDDQTLGFLREMEGFQEQVDYAEAVIASGEDIPNLVTFDGIAPYRLELTPYDDFLSETTFAGLEAKLARYDLTANTGAILGSAAGTTTSMGGYVAISAFKNVIFKGTKKAAYIAVKGATINLTGIAGAAGGTAFVVVAGAVAVNTVAIIQLVQNGEQEIIFNGLVEGGTPARSLADLDFSPEVDLISEDTKPEDLANHLLKEMMVDSLTEMILGK